MRAPLLALAALVVAAAGVAMLHISVPSRPATLIINASTLAAGQNITLHLDYIPMNITVIKPNSTWAVLCMYYRGMLVDEYGSVWVDAYSHPYPPAATAVAETFTNAGDMWSSNATILLIVGQYSCP